MRSSVLTDLIFGLSGLLVLFGIAQNIAEERGENGRYPFLWFLAIVFVAPLALSLWYLVACRGATFVSDAGTKKIKLGVCLLSAVGVLFIATHV